MKALSWPDTAAVLARMPARQLHLLLGGVLAIAAALLWTFAVRAPLAQLRLQHAERDRMALVAADPAQLARQLAALTSALATLETTVAAHGGAAAGADGGQLQLRLIGMAERACARHGVQLRGAMPGPARTVAGFTEVSIDVEAVGSYPALIAWMTDIEAAGALSVVSFDLAAGDGGGGRLVKTRLAAYVLPKESK